MTAATTSSTKAKGVIALMAACLSSLMFGLEISSVPAILPTLETMLHADFRALQWIMNAYTIAVTTVLMAAGTVADRYGRKRVFLIGIIAFGFTSLVAGLSQDVSLLIAARFLQGMSGGVMLICQVAILSHQFREAPARSMAFGWWGIIFGIGLGFGPIIGVGIVAVAGWQWVFLIHALLALVTAGLAVAGVDESRDPGAGRLDIAGIATLALCVFSLALFITQGPALGFTSPAALAILALSAISLIGFIIAERLTPRPMFDVSVFRIRAFSGAIIGSAAMNISFWPLMIYLPIWYQAGLGYGGLAAGFSLLAYTLPTLVVPPLAERLSLRYRPGLIIPGGLFAIGLGFLLMKFGSGAAHSSWLTMLPGALLAGIGLGFTNTPVSNTTTGVVSADRAGMASGIDMSARMISLAINIAVMGFILFRGILSHLENALPSLTETENLRLLAERIAAGNILSLPDIPVETVHEALVQGFGGVLFYGVIGVWLMAIASFITFGPWGMPACTKERGDKPAGG